jgi:methyltransferase (TIGR00027 family)
VSRPDAVSLTALWMAAERARETARPDRLFDDPYAEALAGPEGRELLARMTTPEDNTGRSIPIRTRFFDDAVRRLTGAHGIRQVVLLAAGMDTRAFRLDLPPDLRVFELDRPHLLAVKESRLAAVAARPRTHRITLGTDLSGPWADDLLGAGFRAEPTLWVAEGLLAYLDAAQVHRLLATITELSDDRHWLLVDVVGRSLLESPHFAPWLRRFADGGMAWRFGTDDPQELLAGHGWTADVTRYGDEGANLGRWPWPPAPPGDDRWPRSSAGLGGVCSGQPDSSQPWPNTTASGGRSAACAASRSSTSVREAAPARLSPVSVIPVSVLCTCASMNAGVTSAPSRWTTRSAAGAPADTPDHSMRPPATSRASADGSAALYTGPPRYSTRGVSGRRVMPVSLPPTGR